MIIFEDLSIQTRSDKPNTDWTNGQAKYVVADGSALATKILTCAPYFTPIEDENGNLIDIIVGEMPTPPTPEPTIEERFATLTRMFNANAAITASLIEDLEG